jgi:putative nucleotidyltransferase with HDIG domain
MSRRDEILEKLHTVTALPAAALHVVQTLQDPEASAQTIKQALHHDPGLTSNVLKLANSAIFGSTRRVVSVWDAVARLGTANVSKLVMVVVVSPVVQTPVKGYGLPPNELWKHSAAVALGADFLAEFCRLKSQQSAFTAGLLHDVGKILLGTLLEIDSSPILTLAQQEKIPFDEAERRILDIDHAEVGAALLENWELPPPVVKAVRWHHQPDVETSETVIDLVHAADALCLSGGIGLGIEGLNYRPSSQAVARLKLTSKVNEVVLCKTLSALAELQGMFAQAKGE